jgi:PAS domain S-box-containing protein
LDGNSVAAERPKFWGYDMKKLPTLALLKRFALIYLPIVIILSIFLLSYARLDEQRRMKKIEARENNRITIAKDLVTQDFSVISVDLNIMAKLPYLDSGNPKEAEETKKFFMELMRESNFYDELRYIDSSGQENIRIKYKDGKPEIIPQEQMQNQSTRYFFRDTFRLNQGEVYVSPLDLNVEENRLEIPYKPTIRFGTPLFDNTGRKKGVILFNYFGDKLLQKFRKVMQGDDLHSSMLLNKDGYWLSGDKREDEWGFMLGKSERTFGHDFAEEWRTISAAEQGTLLTANGLFVYNTVHPLLPGQHSSTGSDLVNAPSSKELMTHEYHWKIVSFVPHAELSGATFYNQTSGRAFLLIVYLLLALTAWIIALATLSRKRAEEELRAKEHLLSESQRIAHVGSWYVVLTTGHSILSEEAYRIYGVSPDTFTPNTESFLNLIHPDDRPAMQSWIAACAADQKPGALEFRIIRPDGMVRIINGYGELQHDAGNRPLNLMGFVVDITERKQVEEKIRKLNEELESKVQERTKQLLEAQEELVRKEKLAVLGQVAGSVGHELRNPLGVMNNAVYYLQTVLADADSSVKEYLDIIKDEIAGSERIVSDLLDSVRTKSPQPEMVSLNALIKQTLNKCSVPSFVTVKLDIPATLSALRVDPQQIHQVFRNLISNGVEAMPEGGTLEISSLEDAQAKTITVSVRDTGSGMMPEQLGHLFQPLFTTKARGIGLGLVVVKNLIQTNGGTVQVSSAAGKGSVFSVTLPCGEL